MKCNDARERAAERTLGGLAPAEISELEGHLASCGECRSAAESADRVVAGLKSLEPVEASPARRDRAVAAMAAARGPSLTRRRWAAAAIAAAVFVTLAVPILLPRRGMFVERLDGAAVRIRNGDSFKLSVGDRLQSGDRVETQGVLSLQGPDRLKVVVHRDSKIVVVLGDGAPRIRLLEGAVRVDAPERPMEIEDPLDRRARVSGTCEARFSDVLGWPNPEKKRGIQFHVKKGEAAFGSHSIREGQTMTVSEEGTVKIDDPGRNQK